MAGTVHTVAEGEHISAIAAQYGFGSHIAVWNAPANTELRSLRTDPHQLVPGIRSRFQSGSSLNVSGIQVPSTHSWFNSISSSVIVSVRESIDFLDGTDPVKDQILFSLPCGTRVYASAHSSLEVRSARLSEQGGESICALCEQLQLGRCFLSDHELTERITSQWLSTRLDPKSMQRRILPQPIRTPESKGLKELSTLERRELCTWSYSFIDSRLAPPNSRGFLAQDPNGKPDSSRGWSIRTLNWKECVDHFPTCDVPLGNVIPCVEAVQRVTPFLANQPAGCDALRTCIWGFELERVDAPLR